MYMLHIMDSKNYTFFEELVKASHKEEKKNVNPSVQECHLKTETNISSLLWKNFLPPSGARINFIPKSEKRHMIGEHFM